MVSWLPTQQTSDTFEVSQKHSVNQNEEGIILMICFIVLYKFE